MMTWVYAVAAFTVIGLLLALAYSMTITEEEAQAELDEYVVRHLEDEQ